VEFTTVHETFGERLSKVRKLKGLSQSDLASKMGFSANTTISRFEQNTNYPGFENLLKLHEVLEVDLHWLITGQNYDPQKRLVSRFKETYHQLQQEHDAAQIVVSRLESKPEPLTAEEQQQLLQNRGKVRIAIRQMESFLDRFQDENTP
jgi:transcriptional regulator with XRE-family HTH domain